MKKQIARLHEIRIELTRLYMELGNPYYLSGDQFLAREIEEFEKIDAKNANHGMEKRE